MIDHPILACLGIAATVSTLLFLIVLSAAAQGKRDDEAATQRADAECAADWGNEVSVHDGAPLDA